MACRVRRARALLDAASPGARKLSARRNRVRGSRRHRLQWRGRVFPALESVLGVHLHDDDHRKDVSGELRPTRNRLVVVRRESSGACRRLEPLMGRKLQRLGSRLRDLRRGRRDVVFARIALVHLRREPDVHRDAFGRIALLPDRADLGIVHGQPGDELGRNRAAGRRRAVHGQSRVGVSVSRLPAFRSGEAAPCSTNAYLQTFAPGFPLQLFEQQSLFELQVTPAALQPPPPPSTSVQL